jgi:hypothetical protein
MEADAILKGDTRWLYVFQIQFLKLNTHTFIEPKARAIYLVYVKIAVKRHFAWSKFLVSKSDLVLNINSAEWCMNTAQRDQPDIAL